PSFVAWKEIQIYQTVLAVPPPGSTATPNASTPAASASPPIARSPLATYTPTVTMTPMPTGTPTVTPTSTLTPTPVPSTPYPLPPAVGNDIAPNSQVYTTAIGPTPQSCVFPVQSSSDHSNPCAAIDGSYSTYWAPTPQSHDPQDL